MGKKNILLPLLIDAQWDKALKVIANDHTVTKELITTQSLESFKRSINKTEILPIHQACSISTVQVNVVESLANAYPGSLLRLESVTRRTPLHIAIRARVSDAIIAFIIKKCPVSVLAQDSLGRIPLHYACSNQIPKVTIGRLLEASPESIRATDIHGWTPLHVASSKYQSVDVILDMLRICPESIFDETILGGRPVVLALENKSDAKEAIIKSLELTEEIFQKTPVFTNIRAAEKRSQLLKETNKVDSKFEETNEVDSAICMVIKNTKTLVMRKVVRSNSERCLV